MNKFCVSLLFLLSIHFSIAHATEVNIIFLHHSTGDNLVGEGRVKEWFDTYNSDNGTRYKFNTRFYPGLKPQPMYNYPYNYWNLWVNNACDAKYANERPCFEDLVREYDVIIFKHCYPGSDVEKNTGFPDISSDRKSIENYRLQYRALRDLFDKHPDNHFIIWTLPPRNRVATTYKKARRAKDFVKWVKEDFLTEDGKDHHNISIFDFWGLTAELSKKPGTKGEPYCLKWDYERYHGKRDSHPNETANRTIGLLFGEFIVNSIKTYQSAKK